MKSDAADVSLADRYHAVDDPYLCTWLVRHGVEPDGKALTQRGRVEFCFLKCPLLTKLLATYDTNLEWRAFRLAHQRVWSMIEAVRGQHGRAAG